MFVSRPFVTEAILMLQCTRNFRKILCVTSVRSK